MKKPTSPMFQAISKVGPCLERQLSPFGYAAMDRLALRSGDHVLDLGCGAGATPSQLAARVGVTGSVIGIDIAEDILELGRSHLEDGAPVELAVGDAGNLGVPDKEFDALFSRFGVMGVAEPETAFAGFRRVLKPRGRFAMCCWRRLADNELDHLPVTIAEQQDHVRATPFRFADEGYLFDLLEQAGFRDILITPMDRLVTCGNLDQTVETMLNVGALGQMVRATPSLGTRVEPDLRDVLAMRADANGDVYLNGAVWIVSAVA